MTGAEALQASFRRVAEHGDQVPLYFYSYLFLRHPEVRSMFPPSMAAQRERLLGALVEIVTNVDSTDRLVPFLVDLGKDHRKFSVRPEHYPAVGGALLATLAHFLDDEWTPELEREWTDAFTVVSDVMIQGAAEAAELPAWWNAEIVSHDRRRPDLAVITARVDGHLPYRPGQSVSVEAASRPGMWRYYSPANPARPDGSLEFHVRAVDGGWVSSALVMSAGPGDVLRLGPAVGTLTLDDADVRPLLLIAGGTGLAPLRAIVEDLAARGERRRVHLYIEAFSADELYDLPAISSLADRNPWLTVIPVVRNPPLAPRYHVGRAAEVALGQADWSEHAVLVCGSDGMVEISRELLVAGGVGPDRILAETFSYRVGPGGTTDETVPREVAAADGSPGCRAAPLHSVDGDLVAQRPAAAATADSTVAVGGAQAAAPADLEAVRGTGNGDVHGRARSPVGLRPGRRASDPTTLLARGESMEAQG